MWRLSCSLRGLVPCGLFSVIKSALRYAGYVLMILVAGWWSIERAFAQVVPEVVFRQMVDGQWSANISPEPLCIASAARQSTSTATNIVVYTFTDVYFFSPSYNCRGNRANTNISTGVTTNTTMVFTSISRFPCTVAKPYYDYTLHVCVAAPPLPPNPCALKNGDTFTGTYHVGTEKADGTSDGSGFSPFDHGGYGSDGMCEVLYTSVDGCYGIPPDKKLYCTYTGTYTGASRTPSPENGPPPVTPPDGNTKPQVSPPMGPTPSGKCPLGTVQSGVDSAGTAICMGTGTKPKPPAPPPPKIETSKSEPTPDGGTKQTDTVIVKNSDGSSTTTTTTTTTAPDGTKTTNVDKNTSAGTSGAPGKDESNKEDEKFDLCKQNPMLTICRNSSVSGTCGEITCEGDAIQCSTLRAAAAMQCKQKSDEEALKASPLAAKGQAAIDGTDLAGLPKPGNGQIVNIGSGLQTSQGWLGNGAAFDDVTITVQGKQILVPLSKWSGYLVSLRYVMMIIASLISFRILGSAILKE